MCVCVCVGRPLIRGSVVLGLEGEGTLTILNTQDAERETTIAKNMLTVAEATGRSEGVGDNAAQQA